MSTERKKPEADLRNYYTIILEGGLIVALLVFVVAFKVDLTTEKEEVQLVEKQETVKMEEIQRTKQVEKPPPPPRPPVPVEVPNDEVIEDEIIDLDADLDLDAPMDMPPPPPPAEEEEEDEVFVVVERMPDLKGGMAALQKHIEYPELARKAGIEGRVYVQFVVDENGNVQNPRVVRGIGGGCDEEAIRAVKQVKFTPGMQRGKPVKVQFSLPVVFKLQN
jgi:protein TonB